MIITYKNISDVVFPCFLLPPGDLIFRDGLVFLNGKIVDDRNIEDEILGRRRLETPHKNLFGLRNSIPSKEVLFKNKGNTRYIDRLGHIFIYKKTLYCDIISHKIKRIDRKTIASLVWVSKINFPFKVSRPPPSEYTWAGILYLKQNPWLLYDYFTEKQHTYKRKI